MAERRRGLTAAEATPVASPAPTRPAGGGGKAQPQKPWWWYVTPEGIANEATYWSNRLSAPNKGYRRMGGPASLMGVMPMYVDPQGRFVPHSMLPSTRDTFIGAARVPANLALLSINVRQRLTNGNKPADPRSTVPGQWITAAQRGLTSYLGMPQPEQRKPEDMIHQDLGEQFAAGAIGVFAGGALVPEAAFTAGLFKNMAPWAQQALRWTAGTGTESFVATPLTDNTKGNLANAFGENAPLAVQPTDDMVSAAVKSLLPNAAGEIAVAGAFLGAGHGLGAIGRRAKQARELMDTQRVRNWTKTNGIQTEADGDFNFAPQAPPDPNPAPPAATPDPAAGPAKAPAAPEPAPAAEPAAAQAAQPKTMKEAEDQLLGPEEDAPSYDPRLPEVDVAVRAVEHLDDERLKELAAGDGPVMPQLEQHIQQQQAGFQPDPGMKVDLVTAPTDRLVENPTVPYDQQWQSLPHNQLMSLAHPEVNPELYARIHLDTGRSFEELTRVDVLDGIKALQESGQTLLASRAQPGQTFARTADLSVDAKTFQYKENTNEAGVQKGNSLEGVQRWNPDLEGQVSVWEHPFDGKTYVVNGHNRVDAATRLGVPTLPVKHLIAGTPEQARALGALENIAQGAGTPFDAAKFMKQAGIQDVAGLEAAGIPLKSGLGAQGLALSKLPDTLFQDAVNGTLDLNKALTLGGSGLDQADMIRVMQATGGKNLSGKGFDELVQMATTAPKVDPTAAADGPAIPGLEDYLNDSSILAKADLAARIKGELTSNKNLFKKVGKAKNAEALATRAGTEVDRGAATDAASVALGVLDEFERTKYLTDTPISQLLNQGAAEIAAGAKPDVITKRILRQLEQAAEGAPPAAPAIAAGGTSDAMPDTPEARAEARWAELDPKARDAMAADAKNQLLTPTKLKNRQQFEADFKAKEQAVQQYLAEMPGSNGPGELTEEQFTAKYGVDESTHPQMPSKGRQTPKQLKELEAHRQAERYLQWYDQQGLTPAQRDELRKAAIVRAVQNGEVRPSESPLPNVPEGPRDLNDLNATLQDEIRLAEHYGVEDAIAEQAALEAKRKQLGWDDMTLEERKANGMLDGWEPEASKPLEPMGSSIDEQAAYAREMRQQAERDGNEALAKEWRDHERGLERQRIALAQEQLATSQGGLFGAGEYDTTAPLLNQPAAAEPIRLYRGVRKGEEGAKTVGDGFFFSPDRKVAESYAGPDGSVAEAQVSFSNLLEAKDWMEAKQSLGLPRSASMEDLIKAAREAGHDGLAFTTKNGREYVALKQQGQPLATEVPAPGTPAFAFPADLAKSKPRFGMATVEFGNDFDRAAYVLRDAAKKSKGEDRLIAALEEAGFDIAEVRKHGQAVNDALKAQVKAQTGSARAPQSPMTLKLEPVGAAAPPANAAPLPPAPTIEIPATAGMKLGTPAQVQQAAELLLQWSKHGVPEGMAPIKTIEEAIAAVQAKGARLNTDKVPGLDLDKASDQRAMLGGPEADAVRQAYLQFYGIESQQPGTLASIKGERTIGGMDFGSIPTIETSMGWTPGRLQKLVEHNITEAIDRITGGQLTGIDFKDRYGRVVIPKEWGGDGVRKGQVNGDYNWVNDIITIRGMTQGNPAELLSTAFHEAFHRIQYTLLTLKEMNAFKSFFGSEKVQRLASSYGAGGRDVSTIEKTAVAFQVYADARAQGLRASDEILRKELLDAFDKELPRSDGKSWAGTFRGEAIATVFRGFDRVLGLLEHLENFARGNGFTSVESMFEKAYSGKMAQQRALDFAAEAITPDQQARFHMLEEWTNDANTGQVQLSQLAASIDEEIKGLKAQAMAGGC